MKTKDMKEFLGESPLVEINLRAARLHNFFERYQALHEKHVTEMQKIIEEAREIEIARLDEELKAVKKQKAIVGFRGDDWMEE